MAARNYITKFPFAIHEQCFNEIFINNIISHTVLFCPVLFICSQIAILHMPSCRLSPERQSAHFSVQENFKINQRNYDLYRMIFSPLFFTTDNIVFKGHVMLLPLST